MFLGTPSPQKLSMGRHIRLQASEGIASKKNKQDVFFIPRYFFTEKLGAKRSECFWGLGVPRNFLWAGTFVCKRARELQVKRINKMYFLSQGIFFYQETWSETIARILGTRSPNKQFVGPEHWFASERGNCK